MNKDIWNNFTSDPTTGVTVLTAQDSVILYINEQSLRIFFNEIKSADELIGKSIYDLGFAKEWADERNAIHRQIAATGESVLLRTVWHGKQQFSWMSLLRPDEQDDRPRVLVITRRLPSGEEVEHILGSGHEVYNSSVIRLGDLQTLTPRELEVLTLIGQGMTIKEIAAALFRSVKTVENHRESIGRKLKKTRGVELAAIAKNAGLVVEDSARKRVNTDS
tara:strand:- start:108261 stop:108920 length:660 start_codon:yes stop_codon:yes gene_type:complete